MNQTDSFTVLMATDVPFWRATTGAQQRILSLARYLAARPFRLVTFYVGTTEEVDVSLIRAHQLDVTFFSSAKPPEAFASRLKWYSEATLRQLQRLVQRKPPEESAGDETPVQPLRVQDYRWPWAIEQFRETTRRVQPQAIICQYITMTYLLDALSQAERRSIRCIVDTHDILHDRGMQFGSAGYLHWLEINRDEEISLWRAYDAVLAIQPGEAELIAREARGPQVLLTPHSIEYLRNRCEAVCQREKADRHEVVVGYIGSANYSNWHAINRFMIEAWPDLVSEFGDRVKLLICGKICEWFLLRDWKPERYLQTDRIELNGELEKLEDFYCQVDITINPVQFGTGLKIKNIEAMAFGIPLVTTTAGAAGMDPEAVKMCLVAEDLAGMTGPLKRLVEDPAQRRRLGEGAKKAVETVYSDEQAFGSLRNYFTKLP